MTRPTLSRSFAFLALVFGVASTCSCTSVLGIEDTMLEEPTAATDAGVDALAEASPDVAEDAAEDVPVDVPVDAPVDPTEDWTCVGKVSIPQAPDEITISVATAEFIQVEPTPLEGVEMRVCPAYDGPCANGTTPVASDADGVLMAKVKVPKDGFAGYLQFMKAGYTTLLWQFSRKPTADFSLQVMMVSEAGFAGLRESIGVPVDPQYGHLTFSVVTCGVDGDGNPVPAPGVDVDVPQRNAESLRFYQVGAGFESDATQKLTAQSGRGGIFNLTPKSSSLIVTLPDQPTVKLSEAGGLFIRANTISTIDMVPRAK